MGHAYAKSRIHKGEGAKSNEPNEKLAYYLSHKCTVSQTNWPTIEKETLAIFYSLQIIKPHPKINICMTLNLLSNEITNLSSTSWISQYRTKRFNIGP